MTRKKRIPKPTINPLVAMAPMTTAELQRIMTHYYISLDNLVGDTGTEVDLFVLINVCELAYIAVKTDAFDADYDTFEALTHTAHGIRRAAARVEGGHRAGLDGSTYRYMKELLEQVYTMLQITSTVVVKRWLDTQMGSIRSGIYQCLHAHNDQEHPVVRRSRVAWEL